MPLGEVKGLQYQFRLFRGVIKDGKPLMIPTIVAKSAVVSEPRPGRLFLLLPAGNAGLRVAAPPPPRLLPLSLGADSFPTLTSHLPDAALNADGRDADTLEKNPNLLMIANEAAVLQ